jgi:hypothetical protein
MVRYKQPNPRRHRSYSAPDRTLSVLECEALIIANFAGRSTFSERDLHLAARVIAHQHLQKHTPTTPTTIKQ